MSWAATAVVGSIAAPIIGGYMGAQGAESAAETSAASTDRATRLQQQMYLQGRSDLQPWMNVATGEPQYNRLYDPASFDTGTQEGLVAFSDFVTAQARGDVDAQGYALTGVGAREVTGYGEGGALSQLAGYGRSQVAPGEYIPESAIPEYDPRSAIQGFDVAGDQPAYDRLTDITQDPSYQFRKTEQDRAINRNMAGMGKLMSGNRLEELMARSGDLASQEYGNAYQRNIQDYEIGRGREATGYARDLTGFEQNRLAEESRYGRDVTAYNAASQREALGYGRGVDAYGRAYGEEADYLNRLSNLSNVGQTTATNMAGMGSNAATAMGANIIAGGSARAAGQLGQTAAWTGALGDLASLGTQYSMSQNQPSYTTGAGGSYGYNYPQGVPTNEWVNNPRY
jgi:hypothetical protein